MFNIFYSSTKGIYLISGHLSVSADFPMLKGPIARTKDRVNKDGGHLNVSIGRMSRMFELSVSDF